MLFSGEYRRRRSNNEMRFKRWLLDIFAVVLNQAKKGPAQRGFAKRPVNFFSLFDVGFIGPSDLTAYDIVKDLHNTCIGEASLAAKENFIHQVDQCISCDAVDSIDYGSSI